MAGAKDEAQAAWEAMTAPFIEKVSELFQEHTERLRGRHPQLRGTPGECALIALYAENEVLRGIMKTMSKRITALEAALTEPEERP